MTIKTAVTLVLGAAVGFFAGMSVEEDTKYAAINKVKGKLIFLLTGEKWPRKNPTVGGFVNNTDWHTFEMENFKFDTMDGARKFITDIHNEVERYGTITVTEAYDLMKKEKKLLDYTWSKYYWDKNDIITAAITGPHMEKCRCKTFYCVQITRPRRFIEKTIQEED